MTDLVLIFALIIFGYYLIVQRGCAHGTTLHSKSS